MAKEIVIDKLTPEQEKQLEEYKAQWREIGLCTKPCDRAAGEEAAKLAYKLAGEEPPDRFVWTKSPVDLCNTVKAEADAKGEGEEFNKDVFYKNVCMGYNDADWLGFYDFFQKVMKLDLHEVDGLIKMAYHVGWWIPVKFEKPSPGFPKGESVCYMSERFKAIHLDPQNRLHNTTGPSLEFVDEVKLYHIGGIQLKDGKEQWIEKPETLKTSDIEAETNVELRRILIDIYERQNGKGMFAVDSGAVKEQSDDFGTLYRKKVENDEDILQVKVVNSTPEPDGSFKDYWIRVPPTMKSAKEAIAWSFSQEEDKYAPLKET